MALNDQDKQIIKQMIREEVPKIIENLFSRSLQQLRQFFIRNIN